MKKILVTGILFFTHMGFSASTAETFNAADPNMPAVLGGASYAAASALVDSGLQTLAVKNVADVRLLVQGSGLAGAFVAGYAVGDAIVTWDKNRNDGMLVGFTSEEIIEPTANLLRNLAGSGKQ